MRIIGPDFNGGGISTPFSRVACDARPTRPPTIHIASTHTPADNDCVSAKPTIRAADPADLDGLIALDQIASSTPARRAFIRKSVAQGACLIAAIEDRPIGYVILDYTFFENGFISLVFVAEGHRRSGIGTALVQHAERTCRTPKLFTSTNASNMAMRNLLLGRGYKPSGMVENLDEGDPELIFFQRMPYKANAE